MSLGVETRDGGQQGEQLRLQGEEAAVDGFRERREGGDVARGACEEEHVGGVVGSVGEEEGGGGLVGGDGEGRLVEEEVALEGFGI